MTEGPDYPVATFTTPAAHCGSCLANITEALEPLDGIVSTETDLGSKSVRVVFDPNLMDTSRIAALIAGAGYDVADITG